jgi:hypothetical protein
VEFIDRQMIEYKTVISNAAPQGTINPYRNDPKSAESIPAAQGKIADPTPATANIHPRETRSRMKDSNRG